jgi:YD repeat-containing protein
VEIVRYGYGYGYDDGGRLTEVVNSSGLPLRFGDDAGLVDSWTDRNGHSYRYTYDEYGRCVAQTGADGHLAYCFDYGDREPVTGLRATTVTDSLGAVRRYRVNDRLQVVAEVDPLGHETRTQQDPQHRVLSITDALGRTAAVSYDEDRPTVFTRPDGRTVEVAYNASGLPVRVVDADDSTWRREYDRHGNLLATTDPTGAVTCRTHDERGHLTSATDVLEHTTTVVCDAAGLPVRVTDPLGARTVLERDAFGRLTAVIDPLGAVTRTAAGGGARGCGDLDGADAVGCSRGVAGSVLSGLPFETCGGNGGGVAPF